MNKQSLLRLPVLAVAIAAFVPPSAIYAGTELESSAKDKIVEPLAKELPYGTITFGGKFSEHVQTGIIDSVTPFWAPGDFVLFLNTRTKISDNEQNVGSYGLGTRYLVPGQDIIIGANAYYDSLHSQYSNDFDQLGIGVELLTRWFDARANWYMPDNDIYEIERSTSRKDSDREVLGDFEDGGFFKRRFRESSDKRYSKRYEGALEGYNLEAGFLVPGVDKYFELRLLAGYYNYAGPFDQNFDGFKARVEARFLPGVIADVEYWDDPELMGGNWTAGVRVSIPFSLFNLAKGRNPFEGTGEMFKPRQREFRERLSEQVLRSNTIQTAGSGNVGAGSASEGKNTDFITGLAPKPPVKRVGSPDPVREPSSEPTNEPTFDPSFDPGA